MSTIGSFRKFRLVMWKNLLLMGRNKKLEFTTLSMPVIYVGLAILLRWVQREQYEKSPSLSYSPLDPIRLSNQTGFQHQRLVYYPKNYSKEMEHVRNRLGYNRTIGFKSFDSMNSYFQEHIFVSGVQILLNKKTNTLNITLKIKQMPLESNLWEKQLDIAHSSDPDGHSPYYKTGFTSLQHAIFEAFISNNVTIRLKRFPVQHFIKDPFLALFRSFGIVLVVLCFYNVYLYNLKHIIQEKESQLKEMMLIVGLPNWVDWLAWFTKIMLENIPISILLVFLLKFPIVAIPCLPLTNYAMLWVVIAIYIVSLSTFSMMVTTFFKNSKRSTLLGGLLFFCAIIPILYGYQNPSPAMSIFGLILSPSAFGYAFRAIIIHEQFGLGMQWQYLSTTTPNDDAFPILYYLISMAMSNFFHIPVMLYVEKIYPGQFGTPRPWYFPIEGLLKRQHQMKQLQNIPVPAPGHINCVQPPGEGEVPGMVITQLTKQYKEFYAVNNLTLSANENEIMVLLGENGAGKSTIMAMLTGVIPPTAGTALIYNLDIRTSMKAIRDKVGLCPQRNVYFQQMTVLEHLLFFGKLKGLEHIEALEEATGLLSRLDFADKMNELAETLSGGMKRKLNLAISLAGRSKAVFLDEPTSGIDPASRRDIWNLLQDEKQNRMILLSTHFMDEADVLGDRVAILQHGELKCSGSAFYLKTTFQSAYKLTCAIRDGYKIDAVLNMIRRYVPDTTLRDNYGQEYTFDLNPKYLSSFGELFKRLESSDSAIGLANYGIELPNLEDVFLKVQRDDHNPETAHIKPLDISGQLDYKPLTGCALAWNFFVATVKKKHYYDIRNIFTYLVQVLFPTLILALSILGQTSPTSYKRDCMALSLDTYGSNLVTVTEAQRGHNPQLVAAYKAVVKPYGVVTDTTQLNQYVQDLDLRDYEHFKTHVVVGAQFAGNNTVLAMFNNQAYHSIPISLTVLYNAIIRSSKKKQPQLLFFNNPGSVVARIDLSLSRNSLFSVFLAMALILETGLIGGFYVTDRYSGALNIQFISGLSPLLYWIYTFLMDLIPFNVSILLVIGAYIATEMGEMDSFLPLYLIFFLFGVSVLPLVYLRARRFRSAATFFSNCFVWGLLSILIRIAIGMLESLDDMKRLSLILDDIMLVLPFYNLQDSILKFIINTNSKIDQKHVYTKNYIFFVGSGAMFLFLLILHDLHRMNWFYGLLHRSLREPIGFLEEDVQAEMDKVDAMTADQIKAHLLVAKHLSKSYKKRPAVMDVTFILNRGECLGLLGKNGAGKTTTFKMLTGEETIRTGDAYLNGFSVKNDFMKTNSFFGYCPQVDAVLEDLTGLESMELVGLVRGIPPDKIKDISKSLAIELGFDKHVKKQVSKMSGGNRRKLVTALALIGAPQLVYLDEPTTGLDPSAKRCVWNVMGKYRHTGHSMILATNSMEESEALCTRLAILVDGKMEAIASSYNLKQKYAKTGHLVVQLERSRRKDMAAITEMKESLESQLKGLILKQENQGKLEFEFNVTENLSKVFNLMETIKRRYSIESYAVSNQNSLDNVFLEFVT